MNYFLAPRSGEKSYKNFESTIKHGVLLERIASYLTSDEIAILSNEEVIYAWGNRHGTRAAWNRMESGDLVIFYANKRLVMAGEIYLKKHSSDLALALWPADDNGNPWEYVFFVRNLRYLSIPIQTFNAAVGYKSNNVVQGFTHLSSERIHSIENSYGSVESLLGLFPDNTSTEIPIEAERVYVNLPKATSPLVLNDISLRPRVPGEYVIRNSARPIKIDHAARNKSNAILGNKGEQIVFQFEFKRLVDAGRLDLAQKIERVSTTDDSFGYDILSFETDGRQRYVEVKATAGRNKSVRFFVSTNEYRVGREKENYYIYYIYYIEDVDSVEPKIIQIENPIDESKFYIKPDGYIFEAER